jgi:hypothetical protein
LTSKFSKDFRLMPPGVVLAVSQAGDAVLRIPAGDVVVDDSGLSLVLNRAELEAFATGVALAMKYLEEKAP